MSNVCPCPDNVELAAYVAGITPVEEKEQLEAHLAACDQCRARLKDLISMPTASKSDISPVELPHARQRLEEQLTDWASGERMETEPRAAIVIPLKIRKDQIAAAMIEDRLAATSLVLDPTAVTTFSSDDGAVVAKLQRDEQTSELCLYLIADDMALIMSALIRVTNPEIDFAKEGVPDKYGVVDLGLVSGLNPETTTIDLVLPHATFHLEPRDWHDRLVGETEIRLDEPTGLTLQVELIEQGVQREYRLNLSDLTSEHPRARIRVYATKPGEVIPLDVGPDGIAALQEKQEDLETTVIRVYVVSA